MDALRINKFDSSVRPINILGVDTSLHISNDRVHYPRIATDPNEIINKGYLEDNAIYRTSDGNFLAAYRGNPVDEVGGNIYMDGDSINGRNNDMIFLKPVQGSNGTGVEITGSGTSAGFLRLKGDGNWCIGSSDIADELIIHDGDDVDTTGNQVVAINTDGDFSPKGDIHLGGSKKITASTLLTLDVAGPIAFDSSSGRMGWKNDGTEFGVAGCAWSGTILGYRMIGEEAGHGSYTLTTSFAVPDSDMNVKFVAPPSGKVEIEVQIHRNSSSSNKFLYFGLSDNATYNSIGNTYEQVNSYADETDDFVTTHKWVVGDLTAGTAYQYWLGAKISSTTAFLNWGGTGSNRFCDFIMKATALPTATSEYAEYN